MSASIPPANTPSRALLGFCFIELPSPASIPSARAGSESVIRLIQSRWAGFKIVKLSIVAISIDSTSLMFVASRNCIDFRIFEYILRPSSTAATMVAKLSSASIMSATFLVTSVPVMPIPMPMSADFMAGASLTPSPVMAVTMLLARHAFTILTLCSGCTRAYTEYVPTLLSSSSSDISSRADPSMASSALSMIPRSLPIATAVSSWSPVIMIGLMPALRHSATDAFTSGLIGSIMPTSPTKISPFSRALSEKSSGREA